MSKPNQIADAALASARSWLTRRAATATLTPREAIPAPLAPDLRQEPVCARAVFDALVALEARYDPTLAELYAEDGLVIERVVEGGRERRRREIPMRRYRAGLPAALALAARARIRSSHAQVATQPIASGWVLVRSQRACSQSRGPGPYELLVRRMGEGDWRIVKETATLVL